MSEHAPPIVISLPNGLDLGGVTNWAVRLASAWAARFGPGRATLIVHPRPTHLPAARVHIHPAVRVVEPRQWGERGVPHLTDAGADLSLFEPVYREAIEAAVNVSAIAGNRAPAIYFPNLVGNSYALGAALTHTHADLFRIFAWQHSDSDYDLHLLTHYEQVIARFGAINERYAHMLRARLPHRAGDIAPAFYGADVPATPPPARDPLDRASRPVRLLYAGRIESRQKRIGAIAFAADELSRRGINNEITVIGDGPASAEFDALARMRSTIRRLSAMSPEALCPHYQHADAMILVSRYEGSPISRIEAAAEGCVPIVTHDNSGAADGFEPGVSIELVEARSTDDDQTAGRHLADAIERFVRRPDAARARMSVAAWKAARTTYSMEAHLAHVQSATRAATAAPSRVWPSDQAAAFTSLGPDAAARLRDLLASLAHIGSRGLIIHGAGRHTIELAHVWAESPVPVLAIADDNDDRRGRTLLDLPIISPRDASTTGATDVVISSFIHLETIWKQRARYEDQGMRVHAIYARSIPGRIPAPALRAPVSTPA